MHPSSEPDESQSPEAQKQSSPSSVFHTGVPAAKPNNWKLVLGFIAFLGIAGVVLSLIYGEKPKKFEVMAKRMRPPVRSVYALILSPVDSVRAKTATDAIRSEVCTGDSSDINMIVAGTALYKRFVSAEEFCRILQSSFSDAKTQNVDIDKQAVLVSQLTGILIKDTLRTKVYLFGDLASNDFEVIKKQMNTSARIIVQRNSIFGPVEIQSYLHSAHNDGVRKFLEYFQKQGIPVVLHDPTQSAAPPPGAAPTPNAKP